MFNGIIFNKGLITKILKRPKGINIFIKSDLKLKNKDVGVSVSCDGVCLTLITIKKRIMEFYLSNETIDRSKFKNLKKEKTPNSKALGKKINSNLEKQFTRMVTFTRVIGLMASQRDKEPKFGPTVENTSENFSQANHAEKV